MSQQILVVNDEGAIADLVEVYLTNEGFTVHKFRAAAPALAYVEDMGKITGLTLGRTTTLQKRKDKAQSCPSALF